MANWENNLKRFVEQQGEKHLLKKANEVKTVAATLCPKKTGALASSIAIVPINKKKIKIGSDLPYAFFVEMGTSKMAPRGFLRQALRRVTK